MQIKVEFLAPSDEKEFAEVINTLAKYSEGKEAPPDHWDGRKRSTFYNEVSWGLSNEAAVMIRRLARKLP